MNRWITLATFDEPTIGGGFGTFGQPGTLPSTLSTLGQPKPTLNLDEAFPE